MRPLSDVSGIVTWSDVVTIMVASKPMCMVSRVITKIVIDKLAHRQRAKRRQAIYDELTTHDLSEDELAELWPYVATAVDHGGMATIAVMAFISILPLGVVAFGAFAASEGALMIAAVIVLIGLIIGRYTSWRVYKQWSFTQDLISDLKQNPRTVPDTNVYNWLVEKTDFKSGQAYPDDAPITPQDALDYFDSEDVPVEADASSSG